MVRTCCIDGCEASYYSKGMCKPHYRQDYYLRNGSRERANFKSWRIANLDHEYARWAAYHAEHKDELAALRRDKYWADPASAARKAAEWRERNPGKCDAWRKSNPKLWAMRNRENQRRRHRDKPVDYVAILEEHGMVCHICDCEIESMAGLHFDHVIPLSKGGPHAADNIRPSHAACNLRKGARLLEEVA